MMDWYEMIVSALFGVSCFVVGWRLEPQGTGMARLWLFVAGLYQVGDALKSAVRLLEQ